MKYLILVVVLGLCWGQCFSALVKQTVQYQEGSTILEGYLVYDDSVMEKRPGVLIIHEWWGLTSYIKMRAEQVANLGYVAFAADIYGQGVRPKDMQEAGKTAGIFANDRPLMLKRAVAGLNQLTGNEFVDTNRIAVMGYCFGGGVALELARSGADLDGVVTFHGNLDIPANEDPANIKGKVLVLHGANDPFVNAQIVRSFEDAMRKTKVDWQVVLYSGTVHSFTNPASGNDPSTGIAYNESSDKRSWQAMKDFYQDIFVQK